MHAAESARDQGDWVCGVKEGWEVRKAYLDKRGPSLLLALRDSSSFRFGHGDAVVSCFAALRYVLSKGLVVGVRSD